MHLFTHSDSLSKSETLRRFDKVMYFIRSELIEN